MLSFCLNSHRHSYKFIQYISQYKFTLKIKMFFTFISISIVASLQLVCADQWIHSEWLDHHHKYHLKWKTDDKTETISFLVEVKTKGWIGFGISPNGGMKNSDIVIGWVSDEGKTYFHDRFADDESMPSIDESQDWKLLQSAQNDTHTILQFSRPYKTCDHSKDVEITSDTTKLIWAFGHHDPKSVNSIQMHKHHERGSKNALLIDNEEHEDPKEDDLQYFDFTVNNITIPSKDTVYWCKLFKVQFPEKRHAVKYSAKITPGNEDLTHHFLLFVCIHPDSSQLDKYLNSEGMDCSDYASMPPDLIHCLNAYFIWNTGGQPLIAPPEAGFPIGADEETTYFLLQSHYDNPDLVENRIDSSGFRAYHTSKLRRYDAYTLMFGASPTYRLVIPPKQPSFEVTAHCDMECFREFMPSDGIKVFSVLPHAHFLGRQVKTRHFRGNEELPWIQNERNYDFNFQQFRPLRKILHILPGDIITTECIYNSSLRNFATIGGESTRHEMCTTFLSYYPRMKNNSQTCLSGMTESTVMTISGVEELSGYGRNNDPIIKLPIELQNMSLSKYLTEKEDWNNDYQNLIKFSSQKQACYLIKTSKDIDLNYLVSYPKILKEYKPIETKCQKSDMLVSGAINDKHIIHKLSALFIFVIILSKVLIL